MAEGQGAGGAAGGFGGPLPEPHLEWIHTGTNDVHAISALLGAFILFFGCFSLVVKERLYLSESLVAMLVGIAIGPVGIGLLNPFRWPGELYDTTLYFAEFVISIQVMAAAIGLPRRFWKEQWRALAILYGPVMLWMWLFVALMIWAIVGIDWVHCLVIAACTAPTDPVLANSIITGRFADKYISVPIRELLSGESAANDGLAIPFFRLGMMLMTYASAGKAWGVWGYRVLLYEVGVAVIFGLAVGQGAKMALRFSEKRNFIDKQSFLSFEIALAIFVLGISAMFDFSCFLAVFITGVVFSWDGWFTKETEEAHVQEVVDNLINISFFIYFGSIIPWTAFTTILNLPKLIFMALAILATRRMPIVLALHWFMKPPVYTVRDALLIGHFGPIGVAALWYMAYAQKHGSFTEQHAAIVTFVVFVSVIVYGITAPLMHGMIRTLSVVRVYSTSGRTLSQGGDRGVPAWPSGVPMSANAISGPIFNNAEIVDINAHTGIDMNNSADTVTDQPPGILIKPSDTANSSDDDRQEDEKEDGSPTLSNATDNSSSAPTLTATATVEMSGCAKRINDMSPPAIIVNDDPLDCQIDEQGHTTIHIPSNPHEPKPHSRSSSPAPNQRQQSFRPGNPTLAGRSSTPQLRPGEPGIPPGIPAHVFNGEDDSRLMVGSDGVLVDVGVRFRRFDTQ
ncbi:Sodium/hydrogen exchanger family-domain-containing protein [Phlyctochytrium arcticum]|nr:Sodium/hydrogen exchanger family-domain-containing protein [Phlyctochytrium arcticum]